MHMCLITCWKEQKTSNIWSQHHLTETDSCSRNRWYKIRISLHKTVALATVFHKENFGCYKPFSHYRMDYETMPIIVDKFPQTDDSWICFRKQRKRSKSVDMFPNTDDINLIATRHRDVFCLYFRNDKYCLIFFKKTVAILKQLW